MASDLLSTIRDEIDVRLSELRPMLAEYERLLTAVQALDSEAAASTPDEVAPTAVTTTRRAASRRGRKPAARTETATRSRGRGRAVAASRRTLVDETILGILEHGSHTVAELVVVTALKTSNINGSLRRLRSEGAIVKTEREGKTAWVLSAASS